MEIAAINMEDDIDFMFSIHEQIMQEHKEEEAAMVAQQQQQLYEQQLQLEVQQAEAAVQAFLDDANSVVCPLCQRSQLLQHGSVVFCKCGLRINTQVEQKERERTPGGIFFFSRSSVYFSSV
eukprot:m.273868 g.273868  ORF g.273868 m.273868 type:complete len:122 (+) comp22853_c0_seq24:307-672(+)